MESDFTLMEWVSLYGTMALLVLMLAGILWGD